MASNQDSASKPGTEENEVTKDLVNKDGSVTKLIEWATDNASTPEEMLDLFLDAGVEVSHGEEITGDYTVIHADEKAKFCDAHIGERLMAVQWNFWDGQGDQGEFVSVHIVSRLGKFIVNDSSKGGMYGQFRQITDKRELADPEAASKRTSTAGLMVKNGLRRNKPFFYSKKTKTAIPRRELDDTVKWPMADREESRPTWSLDL